MGWVGELCFGPEKGGSVPLGLGRWPTGGASVGTCPCPDDFADFGVSPGISSLPAPPPPLTLSYALSSQTFCGTSSGK